MQGGRGTTARARVAQRRAMRRARRTYIRALFTLVPLLVAAIGALAVAQFHHQRILPNVSVQGLSLSGLTRQEARDVLVRRYEKFAVAPVTFVLDGHSWRPAAAQVGVRLAIDDAVAEAYAIGRDPDLRERLREVLAALQFGADLPIRVTVDQNRLQAYLSDLAASLEAAPRSAGIAVVGGQVLTTTASIGRQILVDATIREVMAGLTVGQPYTVTLQTRGLQPVLSDSSVADSLQQLAGLLGGPLQLTAGEHSWVWSPADIGSLVRLEHIVSADGMLRVETTVDRTRLTARVKSLAADVARPAVEPRLRFTAAGLDIAVPGRNGVALDVTKAASDIEAALWQDRRTVTLPLIAVEPQVRADTIGTLGITELVAQGKSDFTGSAPYRVTNIIAGARQMDGVLIPPDAEFSFNQTVGAIDESNGFTRGYAIIDGRTQLEWGGGICQVSTTVFRAAYWAGLPITERNQHSFRIRWYEVYEPIGMDAAIFTGPGGYDLRFVNDTGRWLLMQTEVDTNRSLLTVNLYGTRLDREVVQGTADISRRVPAPSRPRYVNDPSLPAGTVKQTDTARDGMDVRVSRIVRQDGRVVRSDVFFSRYQPWPDVFVRGTGS